MVEQHPIFTAAATARGLLTAILVSKESNKQRFSENQLDLMEKAVADLRLAAEVPMVLDWQTMGHPDLEKVKANGTRILIFVPHKVLPAGENGQRYQVCEAKYVIAHWSRPAEPTKSITPGKHSLELADKHGGFWAADRRGIKPVRGAPVLWCYLPPLKGFTDRLAEQKEAQ